MKTLFDTTSIGSFSLKNRFIRSATWEGMADSSGHLTNRLVNVYDELSRGGIGLIITSATVITPEATTIPGILGIYDNSFIPEYQSLTRLCHQNSVPVVMQLTHVGDHGAMWTPQDPSHEQIKRLVKSFGDAAYRAQQSGFDGVQLHAGHGYFISQFLHPRKNTRTDEYGGSVENRTRLILEISSEIRSRVGNDFGIFIKINCSDFQEEDDGVFEACKYACLELATQGIQGIEITGGAGGFPKPPAVMYSESVFRDYAAQIAEMISVPVILVGMNRSPSVMADILNTTRIEYFSLSRPLIRQPDLVNVWRDDPDAGSECTSCDACRQPDGNVCPFRTG